MSKQHILENAKQNGFVHPKAKLILGFGLLGNFIGGLLFGIPIFLGALLDNGFALTSNDLTEPFYFMLFFIIIAFGYGLIPAFLTGLILAYKKYSIRRFSDYAFVALVGAGVSVGITLMPANSSLNLILHMYYFLISIAIVGGLSSMICGKLFLPKASNLTPTNVKEL